MGYFQIYICPCGNFSREGGREGGRGEGGGVVGGSRSNNILDSGMEKNIAQSIAHDMRSMVRMKIGPQNKVCLSTSNERTNHRTENASSPPSRIVGQSSQWDTFKASWTPKNCARTFGARFL